MPYNRRRRSRYYSRRTIGGQGKYQVRRAKAISKAIVVAGRSNKYNDGQTQQTYNVTLSSVLSSDMNINQWKRFMASGTGAGWNLIDINGPGSGLDLREGRRVDVLQIDARCRIVGGGFATTSTTDVAPYTQFEIVMLLDKQCNGAAPPADWYEVNRINTHINTNTLGRYEILKRKKFTDMRQIPLESATIHMGPRTLIFKLSKKFRRPLRVNFNSSTSTGGQFNATVDNSVTLWLFMSGTAATITTQLIWDVDWRTTFQDAA